MTAGRDRQRVNLLFTGLSLSQTTVPLFKPMIIVAFILGFLTCLAFCWKRLRESRRAFFAVCELLEISRRKIEAQQTALSKIPAMAEQMKSNTNLDLGGSVELPAAAVTTIWQRTVSFGVCSGPSRHRRSRFFRR